MVTAASIRTRIESDIRAGVLAPGDRLAAVRSLADEIGVSPNTVAAAYRQLRDRGAVVGRGRQGTVVAPARRPVQGQVSLVPDGVVDAMRGSPDPALLPDLAPALARACAGDSVRYGDDLLDPGFEAAAREMFSADGITAGFLTATSGAMDAVEKVLAANDLRPGDRVGVEDPGHVPVHQLVRAAGLELVPLPIDEEGVTTAGLGAALDVGLSALIITPRAQNPTGASLTSERAQALSETLAPHPGIVLIQDDHAGPISGALPILVDPPGPRFAVIKSLGKSLGPDLRISITTGDQVTVDRVAIAVSNGPGWVSHLLQRAAAHLLSDTSSVSQVTAAEQTYSNRRERMIATLATFGVNATGSSGLNVWIPTADEQGAVDAARSAGYAIRAADTYRVVSGPAVRVTISTLTDAQIDELSAVLADHLLARRRAPAV